MRNQSRLLGIAFAASDVLIELDGDGRILFAMGAGPVAGDDVETDWVGRPLTDLLGKASRRSLSQALLALKPGERSGPIEVMFLGRDRMVRRGAVRAFILPQLAPNVSCAIAWQGAPFPLAVPDAPPVMDAAGLLSKASDLMAGGLSDGSMTVSFVDVPGLADAPGEQGQRATARVEATLQAASMDGSSTARLTPERYALLAERGVAAALSDAVTEAAAAEGVSVQPRAYAAGMNLSEPVSALRAMRFALEGCIKDGGLERPDVVFEQAFKRTLSEAQKFRAMVKARDFDLHYQPIVALDTRAVHHFEALARFGEAGPAALIHMAEQLGLIEALDLAVAEKTISKLRQPGAGLLKIAVNLSADSLTDDGYVNALLRMTASAPEVRRRLIVEVTETAALADIEAADRRLTALRGSGIKVCIDDFGSGSAGFDYLRRLSVDAVKIDGGLIAGIGDDLRGRAVIRSLVELSNSLSLTTIAERIETEAEAEAVAALGVRYGQGYLFGRPEAEPRVAATAAAAVRRKGAVEAWG